MPQFLNREQENTWMWIADRVFLAGRDGCGIKSGFKKLPPFGGHVDNTHCYNCINVLTYDSYGSSESPLYFAQDFSVHSGRESSCTVFRQQAGKFVYGFLFHGWAGERAKSVVKQKPASGMGRSGVCTCSGEADGNAVRDVSGPV